MDRIFMLTTDENLDFLCQSVRLCGDGTFKAAPKLWTQLYTIHGQKNGFTVPCVFALLPDKRKETYTRLFRQLKSWLSEFSTTWDFESYLSDFEKGAYLAAKDVFTGIREEGCFFHMAKRLDLHVKQLGLMPKYQIDMGFRTRVKCLAALAFIPVSDLVAVYEALSTTFLADEISILHYFESTCIGMGVGADRLRRDPAFPHQMWNVLDRHDQGSTRTTNALEAFHHSFNALISCQHPSIWTLLDSLKRQQALTLNTISEIQRGQTFNPSAKERMRNDRIMRLVSQYSPANADRTLRGIAYNFF